MCCSCLFLHYSSPLLNGVQYRHDYDCTVEPWLIKKINNNTSANWHPRSTRRILITQSGLHPRNILIEFYKFGSLAHTFSDGVWSTLSFDKVHCRPITANTISIWLSAYSCLLLFDDRQYMSCAIWIGISGSGSDQVLTQPTFMIAPNGHLHSRMFIFSNDHMIEYNRRGYYSYHHIFLYHYLHIVICYFPWWPQ